MNQQDKFNETVGILAKAYLQGTLKKGDCAACAVGNICAAAHGATVITGAWLLANREEMWPHWQELFVTHVSWEPQDTRYTRRSFDWSEPAARAGQAQIAATGYSIAELARIEYAFESALQSRGPEAEYAGLMAVVDILADIHGIDLAAAAASKALFVKA